MKVDLDKFLVSDKGEKRIYGSSFGFVTVKCIPKEFEVSYREKTADYYGNHTTKQAVVSLDKIYAAKQVSQTYRSGRYEYKYTYRKYSLNTGLESVEKLAVKIRNSYYITIQCPVLDSVQLVANNNIDLFNKVFGKYVSAERAARLRYGSSNSPSKNYNVLKEVLESVDWREDDAHTTVSVDNINDIHAGTKVFFDTADCGEGEIVKCATFDVQNQAASYEVKLYNGEIRTIPFGKNWKFLVNKNYMPKDELAPLKESIAEELLDSYAVNMADGFNVYWQSVEKAASYLVELYRWRGESILNKLYKLEKREVSRGKCYETFTDLAKGQYYVRVLAEDRSGDILAKAKAISVVL